MNANQVRTSDNHRIIVNTLLLYVRMFLIMGIAIWTTRLLLQILGDGGYGTFTVVTGLVALAGFFNFAMLSTVQRFLNIEVGKQREQRAARAFSCGTILFALLGGLVLLLGETIGLWFFHHKLELPPDQVRGAAILYQFLLFAFAAKLLQMPCYAVIIANERMNFLALLGALEAFLNLTAVLLLYLVEKPLALYGALTFVNTLVIFFFYFLYCRKRYPAICTLHLRWDSRYMSQMGSFSGWSIFGSLATGTAQQGLNILLNLFGGVIVNAAMGLCLQISTAVNTFLGNFQTAFCPHLVKTHARNEREYLFYLICRTAKYSFFLLSLIVFPLLGDTQKILEFFWGTLPPDTVLFVQLALIQLLLNSLSCPLYTTIQATGKIRNYQIVTGGVLICLLPISYLFLYWGFPFYCVFLVYMALDVLALVVRVYFLRLLLDFSPLLFIKSVLGRVIPVAAAITIGVKLLPSFGGNFFQLGLFCCVLDLMVLAVIAVIGMSGGELLFLYQSLIHKLKSFTQSKRPENPTV